MPSELTTLLRTLAEGGTVEAERARRVLADDPEAAAALVDLSRKGEALRRRSAELRAVMSSTRDLLSMPDADLMLQRIVDRAHELLEGDVAYLSVYEPVRDELFVRAVTGEISARFLNMVVPAGVGLASLAVRTRHPQWVEDYAKLTAVPHDSTIDAIMREENLHSLLGAPLVVGETVLGVLFAAWRDRHGPRPDEVALLSAFAAHAALVLHLAQLLRQANDATAEAARRQGDAEWAAALHGDQTELIVDGQDAVAVVAALAAALGREVLLVDTDDIGNQTQAREPQVRKAVRDAIGTGRSAAVVESRFELAVPVVAAQRTEILLVERGDRALSDAERRAVERSALMVALVLSKGDAVIEAEERMRGELAAELLDRSANRAVNIRRAAARGYQVDRAWAIAAVPCDTHERGRLVARLRGRAEWLVAASPQGLTALVPTTGSDADAGAVADEIRAQLAPNAKLVLARVLPTLSAAAGAAPEIWKTSTLARGMGIDHGAIDVSTLIPYGALFDGDGARLSAFIETMLEPVLAWDRAHGANLIDTLLALCDERWSLTGAARALHVHVNTMKQRIQRLRTLLGDRLDTPETRFRLEMAVRVEHARRVIEETS